MSALNQVTEYLLTKVQRIKDPTNPRANAGAVMLRLHKGIEEDMEKLVSISFQCIQMHFTKDSSSDPAGTAQLTAVSTLIGRRVLQGMGNNYEDFPWNSHVQLGDLFIEAYYNNNFVDIYYPKQRDASYIVSATTDWINLADIPEATTRINLKGTTINKPNKITGMQQTQSLYLTQNGGGYFEALETMASDESPRVYSETVIKGADSKLELEPERPWLSAMNKLQQTAWRINRRVYDALTANKDTFVSADRIYDNDAKELKRRSKAVEWGFIIHKAEMLLPANQFYQFMEADYRGRLYYSEPFLNFQGSDLARGMLKFARGKPMTEDGLFWLAVHTAASYNRSYNIDEIPEWAEADYKSYLEAEGLESISVDKFTLEDRVRWTNEHMHIIIEAGRTGHIFSDAEKPVSLLACCIEWCDYERAQSSGRIHMSHLPIPVDGSNNGWQHLGAMSKDERTGELVGLTRTVIQRDFYVQTAKELYGLTDGRVREILDSMPMKHIRKGISKRGSMTRAYSAGASKIGENMWFDCKTEDFHEKYDITQDDCTKLAKVLVKAINNVCPGPLETMGYMQDLASYEIGKYQKFAPDGTPAGDEYKQIIKQQKELYSKKDKTDEELEELNDLTVAMQTYESRLVYGNGRDRLTWTTPSGFPVEYTCFNTATRKCRGRISGLKIGTTSQVNHVARIPTKAPDVRGFMCGVSPNFVHSLDASHMALVIDDWHGEFGAVHDSFSTHACDVEELLVKTKQKFVDIYDTDNFFDTIRREITNNTDDVEQPSLGNLDITEVYDSDYFFA